MRTQSHSQLRNQEGEGRPPLPFLKIKKSVLILEKKALTMPSLGQIFLSKSSFFLGYLWAIFSCVFYKMFFEFPQFHNPLPPLSHENFLVKHLHPGIILFAKHSILNIWQSTEYVCFDSCFVICTVILCNILPQTHSELWHIHELVFSGICWHNQSYSPCYIQN